MPMIRTCSAPGCRTRTLGEFCLEHEPLRADDDVTGPARAGPPTRGQHGVRLTRPTFPDERTPRDVTTASSLVDRLAR